MTSIPVENPDFRCAPWTTAQGVDPVGSAVRFDRLVLVEVPQPWPDDVEDLDWIAALAPPAGTRIQSIVPESGRSGGDVMVTRWERDGARMVGTDWLVAAEHVVDVLAVVVTGADPDPESAAGVGLAAPDDVLICSHGTRDRCCGGSGTRLAVEARAALPGSRIRRTSHIGGHRFAPTAMTLPDGRMWAYLDVDALAGIVGRTLAPAQAREFYRGTTALDPWAQVMEAELLTANGWDGLDLDTVDATVTPLDDPRDDAADDARRTPAGRRADVAVHWTGTLGDDTRSGVVEVAQHYPVLVCGFEPSEAKKSAIEYRISRH